MSDTRISAAVLRRVAEFIADIPEEHLADIADGRARLTFIPAESDEPRRPASAGTRRTRSAEPAVDINEAREALAAMDTREEGRLYLGRLRQKPELIPLAKLLSLPVSGTKPELIERIVERTIGSRRNSAAVREL